MKKFGGLPDRFFLSWKWRLGLVRHSWQLDRIEDKLDYLLRQSPLAPCGGDILTHEPESNAFCAAFLTDRKYFYPTLAAIHSLYRHTEKPGSVKIFLILADCSDAEKEKAERLFPHLQIIIADLPKQQITSSTHVTSTALLKFDLPSLLPGVDRVLYLDSDVLVCRDLTELFMTPLENSWAAVVKDCGAFHDHYPQKHSIRSGRNYFNSGVMLLDLDRMRREKIGEQLHSARERNPNYHFVDQDCFNEVFADHVVYLPMHNNLLYGHWKMRLMQVEELSGFYGISASMVQRCIMNPAILHFAYPKPWDSTGAFGYEFWQEEERLLLTYASSKGIALSL